MRSQKNINKEKSKIYFAAAFGLLLADSSSQVPRILGEQFEYRSEIIEPCQNSTRFNNADRFSLEKLKENRRKLSHFGNLGSNWNGYNSVPIETTIIDQVLTLISDLDFQPSIFPTGRGTLQLEYFKNEENFLELEIFSNEGFLYKIENGNETETSVSLEDLPKLISEFHA